MVCEVDGHDNLAEAHAVVTPAAIQLEARARGLLLKARGVSFLGLNGPYQFAFFHLAGLDPHCRCQFLDFLYLHQIRSLCL